MTLVDFQFELGGVVFGKGQPVRVRTLDTGTSTTRNQDHDGPGDYRWFGRDWITPADWVFELHTRTDGGPAAALQAASELGSVWDAVATRGTPGAVLPLRYRMAGRVRRVYGRPRRWSAPPARTIHAGYLPIVADFARSDGNHYDDTERSVSSDLTGSTNPLGISSPVRSPFAATFGNWTAPTRTAVVGGDRATWPIIEFRGGVNPWAEVAGWRCRVLASLNWDEVVTVDTRPWVRSSTLNGSYAPLDRGSRLQEMQLPPGNWPVRYGNDSSVGAPSVTVRWRNAWSSL